MWIIFDVIGTLPLPSHLASGYGGVTDDGGGLAGLLSSIIKLIIVVGGVWSLFNLLIAGFYYVMYGDKPEELLKAHQKIYMSLIGLVLMAGSFVVAGIIGWIVFGDPRVILEPQVYGP